ncbi:MAG: hypothetical protein PHP08_03835 [Candidatus Dojkabacteria bacterium]|nr:hypothetical protein [Candidatus Dojkabacteria bacterium]
MAKPRDLKKEISKDTRNKKSDSYSDKYWDTLQANKHKSEETERWTVENYNSLSRSFSERIFTLAGVGLGLLPLIFQFLKPEGNFEKHLLHFVIIFLFLSIVMGSIDLIVSLKFWDRNRIQSGNKTDIWQRWISKVSAGEMSSKRGYTKAINEYNNLRSNSTLKVSEVFIVLQTGFVLLAFLLETVYLGITVFK